MSRTTAVIYLWAPDDATAAASFDELSVRCEQYAFRFCWEVVETVHDVGGSNEHLDRRARSNNAFGRTGLDRLLAILTEKRALIVLVPDPQMVGGTAPVYNAVRECVEKHGCFLQVVRDTPQDAETQTPKARILALAKSADFSDSFGALLHMTAFLISDPKTLVPKTEEERSVWGGHLDGLHAALLCLARHERQCAPEATAETVGSLLRRARAVLQDSAPGSGGSRA